MKNQRFVAIDMRHLRKCEQQKYVVIPNNCFCYACGIRSMSLSSAPVTHEISSYGRNRTEIKFILKNLGGVLFPVIFINYFFVVS